MADHKFQMSDGKFPIDACTGENSVESAAKLAHNSTTHSFEEVKAHVLKAKKALGCPDSVLPESWGSDQSNSASPIPYADLGFQKDGRKRYPIDTSEHIKTSWQFINQAEDASRYSTDQLARIKNKIKVAAEKLGVEIGAEQKLGVEISAEQKSARPPRDSLIRGVFPLELRSAESGMPTLFGHFAVFGRWTEIDSVWEGQFMEQLAPGAFKKTMAENRSNMRVLFNHGKDPAIGDKVLGPIEQLREDENGAYYEVPLLDTSYNRDLLPGLEKGLYGASFRFSVMKEAMNQKPQRSDWNPEGLPERTIQEVALREFGPVTFPAYTEATAGIRSLTDDFIVRQLVGDPERLQSLLSQQSALSRPGAEPAHSAVREPQQSPRWPQISREEFLGKSRSGRAPFNS